MQTIKRVFSPADRTVNETRALFEIPRGSRVVWAGDEKNVLASAGSTSTMTLGDGADPDGYVTTANLDLETGSAGDLGSGTGAYLTTAGGKLYTADDTIDVDYVASGTPGSVTPRVTFAIGLVREWMG
jgi:hypothetical protein